MRAQRNIVAVVAGIGLISVASLYAARVGEPAPDFVAKDSKGQEHKLADYKGKWVVLEWHNQGCPYVKKHYDSGNMQKLQKAWGAKGVVWLTKTQMAAALQISVRSLNNLMARGDVAFFRIGPRLVRFRIEEALKRMSERVLVAAED